MPSIPQYPRDKNINDEDLILGADEATMTTVTYTVLDLVTYIHSHEEAITLDEVFADPRFASTVLDAISERVKTPVPENAVFTDTTLTPAEVEAIINRDYVQDLAKELSLDDFVGWVELNNRIIAQENKIGTTSEERAKLALITIQNPVSIDAVAADALTANDWVTDHGVDAAHVADLITIVNPTDIDAEVGRINNNETKLAGIEAGAEVNVQSDWNVTTSGSDDYIRNKPDTITSGEKDAISANTQRSEGNKTKLDTLPIGSSQDGDYGIRVTGGSSAYTDSTNLALDQPQIVGGITDTAAFRASIGAAGSSAQSDWDQTNSTEPDFIKNKPVTITSAQTTAITANTAKVGITGGQTAAINANTAKISFDEMSSDKLDSIQSGAEVNVLPDWNETDVTMDDFILNKPTTITAQESNNITINTERRTPAIPTIGTDETQEYILKVTDIAGVENNTWEIASQQQQVQVDWTETDINSVEYIKNKPTTISATQASEIAANTNKTGISTQQAADIVTNTAKVGVDATLLGRVAANDIKIGFAPALVDSALDINRATGGVSQFLNEKGEYVFLNPNTTATTVLGTSGEIVVDSVGSQATVSLSDIITQEIDGNATAIAANTAAIATAGGTVFHTFTKLADGTLRWNTYDKDDDEAFNAADLDDYTTFPSGVSFSLDTNINLIQTI